MLYFANHVVNLTLSLNKDYFCSTGSGGAKMVKNLPKSKPEGVLPAHIHSHMCAPETEPLTRQVEPRTPSRCRLTEPSRQLVPALPENASTRRQKQTERRAERGKSIHTTARSTGFGSLPVGQVR